MTTDPGLIRLLPDDPLVVEPPREVHRAATDEILRWAEDVLRDAGLGFSAEIQNVNVLRDGAKRLIVVALSDGASLVLKQYPNDRGAWTKTWMERLCHAGFTPPARLSVTLARGWSQSHSTLVADLAPDYSWTSWLVGSPEASTEAAEAAADWLIALQGCDISLPDRSGYRAADELARNCTELSNAFPAYAESLEGMNSIIRSELYDNLHSIDIDLVPSHGDLHPDNLHIADDEGLSVMAIDVDTAGLRRPSYDVGYAIAQMLIVSWMRTCDFDVGAAAALAFWRRWRADDGRDADAVGAEAARALLQSLHFELVTYRNGKTELLTPWLSVAHSMTTSGVAATLRTLAHTQEIAS